MAVEIVDGNGLSHALVGGDDPATGTITDEASTHVYRAVHGRWCRAASDSPGAFAPLASLLAWAALAARRRRRRVA